MNFQPPLFELPSHRGSLHTRRLTVGFLRETQREFILISIFNEAAIQDTRRKNISCRCRSLQDIGYLQSRCEPQYFSFEEEPQAVSLMSVRRTGRILSPISHLLLCRWTCAQINLFSRIGTLVLISLPSNSKDLTWGINSIIPGKSIFWGPKGK